MSRSKIEWTDFTFNPWWGCERVSPGCANCYAEALANRYGQKLWGATAPRRMFGEAHWKEPRGWNDQAKRDGRLYRVFCASMADLLEERPELVEPRQRVIDLAFETPYLIWLFLTKRPENAGLLPRRLPANCMLGVTIEDQARYEQRALAIAQMQAAYPEHRTFFSVEPMLSPIHFRFELACDWVICGGESGSRARPTHPDWARKLRDDCGSAGVPFFFKQWGEWAPHVELSEMTEGVRRIGKKKAGRMLDGRTHNDLPEYWPANVGLREDEQLTENTDSRLEVLA